MKTWLANPWALSLLAVLPALTVLAAIGRWLRRRRRTRLGSPGALAGLIEGSRGWPRLRALGLTLALLIWIVGIAGPQWGHDPHATATSGRDLIVLIDVSRSMTADDVFGGRLEQAKRAAIELAETVQRRGGHRLGLVAVAAQARIVCPLTEDFDHFREKVADLDVDELAATLGPAAEATSGTRLGVGLRTAVAALDERYRAGQTVLMISDGDDPAGDEEEWQVGINAANEVAVTVHTVGIGDPTKQRLLPVRFDDQPVGSRLHEEPLKAIARATGGDYLAARTQPPALGELFQQRIEPGPKRDVNDDAVPVYQQRYAGFLAAALGLLTMGLLMNPGVFRWASGGRKPPESRTLGGLTPPARRRRWWFFAVPLLLVSAAPAPESLDAVRQGNEAFARRDFQAAVKFYEQAEPTCTDPGLVAFNTATALVHLAEQTPDESQRAAYYRAAELHYRSCVGDNDLARRARALYGLGTCLLHESQGKDRKPLDGAIDSFGRCLDIVTDAELTAAARHNRELAKLLWLKAAATSPKKGGNDPDKEPQDDPKSGSPNKNGSRDPNPSVGKVRPEKVKPENGSPAKPIITKEPPPPGGNGLQPLPDTAQPVKLPAEDAAEHLRQAAERVAQERRDYLRRPVPPRANVKDW